MDTELDLQNACLFIGYSGNASIDVPSLRPLTNRVQASVVHYAASPKITILATSFLVLAGRNPNRAYPYLIGPL